MSAAGGRLTEEERERIVQMLLESRDAFLAAVRGLRPEQWRFKPAPEVWSIAENCDHVGALEGIFLGMIQNRLVDSPERAEAVQGKHKIIQRAALNRETRVKVPIEVPPFGHTATPEEFEEAFVAARERTIEYARTTLDPLHLRVQRHFVLGDFDGAQWLEMIAAHTLRHRAQIEEAKSAAGYPG
jgi:uncharacterized damage-inducible protein DinB